MLSILIPVYNFDVRKLTTDLQSQCVAMGEEFEIILMDDASNSSFQHLNKQLSKLSGVVYEELEKNIGRAAIRNKLAAKAKYDTLIFMDCDSKVLSRDFIKKYLISAQSDAVVCGGRTYFATPPESPLLMLHWKFGKDREQSDASRRAISPWHSFMTNNFLIPKNIMLQIGFDETLRHYGHEDTLFGLELAALKIPVKHINNPLEHVGLETSNEFLVKSRQALDNLFFLEQSGKLIETKLLRHYKLLKRFGLIRILSSIFNRYQSRMEGHLKSSNPSLFVFDFYKLSYFAHITQKFEIEKT